MCVCLVQRAENLPWGHAPRVRYMPKVISLTQSFKLVLGDKIILIFEPLIIKVKDNDKYEYQCLSYFEYFLWDILSRFK